MLAAWWARVLGWLAAPLQRRIEDLEAELAETRLLVERLCRMPHNRWTPDGGWLSPPPLESGFTITPHARIGRSR